MKTFDIPFQIQGRITLTIYEKPVDTAFLRERGPISAPIVFNFTVTPPGPWPAPDTLVYESGDDAFLSQIDQGKIPAQPDFWELWSSDTGEGNPTTNPAGWTLESTTLGANDPPNYDNGETGPYKLFNLARFSLNGIYSDWSPYATPGVNPYLSQSSFAPSGIFVSWTWGGAAEPNHWVLWGTTDNITYNPIFTYAGSLRTQTDDLSAYLGVYIAGYNSAGDQITSNSNPPVSIVFDGPVLNQTDYTDGYVSWTWSNPDPANWELWISTSGGPPFTLFHTYAGSVRTETDSLYAANAAACYLIGPGTAKSNIVDIV